MNLKSIICCIALGVAIDATAYVHFIPKLHHGNFNRESHRKLTPQIDSLLDSDGKLLLRDNAVPKAEKSVAPERVTPSSPLSVALSERLSLCCDDIIRLGKMPIYMPQLLECKKAFRKVIAFRLRVICSEVSPSNAKIIDDAIARIESDQTLLPPEKSDPHCRKIVESLKKLIKRKQ